MGIKNHFWNIRSFAGLLEQQQISGRPKGIHNVIAKTYLMHAYVIIALYSTMHVRYVSSLYLSDMWPKKGIPKNHLDCISSFIQKDKSRTFSM